MRYPEYVEVNGRKYKINTDFRIAIECNQIATDSTIGDYERGLAVVYKLFGDEGIDNKEDTQKLLEMAKKYLLCGAEYVDTSQEPDMDYVQDMDYIEASFMSDYHIDLTETKMHWWKFNNLMNGLSNSELGDCCVLNRIRNLRNYDTKDIKDSKERQKIEEAKQRVALKKKTATEEQEENAEKLLKELGLL